MKDLLEAGVHFGHQTKRWNPKMKEYIFGERNGIYIIDLGKTVKLFREAEDLVTSLASEGRTILFVGTKRQAQDVIAEEAQRCGMYFVNERWLGGLLTNFATIQRSLGRLRDLETMATDGRYDTLSKKEIARNEKERRKLQKNLEGIRGMSRLPDAVFVSATEILRELRTVKSIEEIEAMRRAGVVTEAAFQDVLSHLKLGMTELDIVSEVDYQLRKHGGLGPSFTTSLYNSGPDHPMIWGDRLTTWKRRGEHGPG